MLFWSFDGKCSIWMNLSYVENVPHCSPLHYLHLCQTLYLGSIKNIAKSYYSVHFGKWKSKVLKYVMWNLNYAAIRKSHWVGLSRKLAWVGLMMHYLTKNTLENWAWHCPVITLSSTEAAIGLRVVPSWCLVRFGVVFCLSNTGMSFSSEFLWVATVHVCFIPNMPDAEFCSSIFSSED